MEHRERVRLRATLDIVLHSQHNQTYLDKRQIFIKIRDQDGGIAKYTSVANSNDDECAAIREVLNFYELIAIGIDIGIVDEEMYKRYYRMTVISDWEACESFILQLRRNEQKRRGMQEEPPFYVEFEKLAKSWKR